MNTKRAKVISFVNMKGGVCKTSLTINIGNELVNMGCNVLIVDMDPQFNATQSLLLHKCKMNVVDYDKNITEEFEFEQEISSSEKYKELSERGETVLQLFRGTSLSDKPKNPKLIHNIKENLDLMPGDLYVSKEVSGDTAQKLSCLLDHFRCNHMFTTYDYILIDCPPTWSILTHASLYASDYYIIPSKIDLYSSIGIKLLEEQVEENLMRNSTYTDSIYKREREGEGTTIKRLGVIFTLVDRLQTAQNRKQKLKEEFPNIDFFQSELPYIPSVPTKIVMYEEVRDNSKYSQLNNAISKITDEIIDKTK